MGRYESLFEEVEVDDWWDADEGDDEDGEGDDDGDVVWALKPGEVDPCVPGSSNMSHVARHIARCTWRATWHGSRCASWTSRDGPGTHVFRARCCRVSRCAVFSYEPKLGPMHLLCDPQVGSDSHLGHIPT